MCVCVWGGGSLVTLVGFMTQNTSMVYAPRIYNLFCMFCTVFLYSYFRYKYTVWNHVKRGEGRPFKVLELLIIDMEKDEIRSLPHIIYQYPFSIG